jgi:NAD(P)-dependent dehydrogenase (short-subunit alcohol dehydrogenase family)
MSQHSHLGKVAVALGLAGLFLASAARRRKRVSLRGRVAVITGGARGLGLAITRELLARGCRVAICGRNAQLVEDAVEDLAEAGAQVFGTACDTSDGEAANEFIRAVLDHYGSIDVLVNNAGQCFVGPAVELGAADLDHALRNIFWLQYHPTMAVLPHMRKRGFGRIANITSLAGKAPVPHQAAYVAGKYAATGWSQTLATELSREGIQVSTITPPPLKNGAPLHVHFNGRVDQEFRWFARMLTSRFTAASAQRAARVVVDALEHGDFERAVTPFSWFISRLHGMAPNLNLRLLAAIERLQPAAAGPGVSSHMRLGREVAVLSNDEGVRARAATARADEARYLPGT